MNNPHTNRTKAKRVLLSQKTISLILCRVGLGATLNKAVQLEVPHMSTVAAIKLVRWYREMDSALAEGDELLAQTISESLFPDWEEQPEQAIYFGVFPYGYWEY